MAAVCTQFLSRRCLNPGIIPFSFFAKLCEFAAQKHFLQKQITFVCINLKHSQKHGPPGHRNREEHVHPLPRCPGAHFGATVYQRIACQRIPSTVRNTINAHKYAEIRGLSALLRELGPGQHPNFVPFLSRRCLTFRSAQSSEKYDKSTRNRDKNAKK